MSLYNKFRPMGWGEVIGQRGVITSLTRMIANNTVSSTILFYGPRGTGKTTCARIFAKALNCLNPKEPGVPCCECDNCKDIALGNSLNVLELDGASNTGIDNMRELKSSSNLVGMGGGWKVYIIDECHMLSKAAQNSALKMLEESPEKTVFILATTELHKVEGTIVSRAMMFDFRPVTIDIIADKLKFICTQEGFEFEDAALSMVAKVAHGGVRDSISTLERVSLENGKRVFVDGLVRSLGITPTEVLMKLGGVIRGEYRDSIELAEKVISEGYDIFQFLNSAIDYYRGVLMLKLGMNHLVKVENVLMEDMDMVGGTVSQLHISNSISILEDGISKYKYTEDKQILLELILYKIADLSNTKSSTGEIKAPSNIDEAMIERMMREQFVKLMAGSNIQNNVVIQQQAPQATVQPSVQQEQSQVQQNQSIRQDTVNNGGDISQNDNIAERMLGYLKSNWDRFIKILEGNNTAISTIVGMTAPISFENNTLVLRFPTDASFYLEMFNMQMAGDTSIILSGCMNVKCSVIGVAENDNSSDTVHNTHISAPEIQNNVVEKLSFNINDRPAENQIVDKQQIYTEPSIPINIIDPNVRAPITSKPIIDATQVATTQSVSGQPLYTEEKKMTKEDVVDMGMLDVMF